MIIKLHNATLSTPSPHEMEPCKEAGETEEPASMLQQLMNMGFPEDLSAAALTATSSKSTSLAADWILNNHYSPTPPQSQPTNKGQSLLQYFPSNSKPQQPPPPAKRQKITSSEPLSERMRPRTIDDVIGQDHLLGPNSILRSALSRHRLPSLILWGPPGVGKTSIARAIANAATPSYRFVSLSAVSSGVKEVRDVLEEARRLSRYQQHRTVLFVDEVHRFNRAQLDSFLPAVEAGTIVFIGATTENPSFHLTTPLLSRCRVLSLRPLQPPHVSAVIDRAVSDTERGLPLTSGTVSVDREAVDLLSTSCDGDARIALNALEVAATLALDRTSGGNIVVGTDDVREALQCKHLAYDRAGEEHYNLISALHKSMRGGDADAAIYWLARMLEGGEQPLYIARRLVRFASEDVGLADPNALLQAVSCYQACHFLGLPECDVNLAQCVAYLALAPKSVAAYKALKAAREAVKESAGGNEGVPLHLRNAPTKLMKDLGYGEGYIYPPDHIDLPPQSFLPRSLLGRKFLDWHPLPPNGPKQ